MMHLTPLLIRADADDRIGTGHVMRCLAIAQAWQDGGGETHFAVARDIVGLRKRLEHETCELHPLDSPPGSVSDAQETCSLAQSLQAGWIIVDGYHFDDSFQVWLKDSGRQFVLIDDHAHCQNYYADLVVNQNLHARESLYPRRDKNTRLLLGSKYALLRREFREWSNARRKIPRIARRILVTFGGSDPDNVTLRSFEALRMIASAKGLPHVEVVVVLGPGNRYADEIRSASADLKVSLEIVQNVSDMPQLMAWADLALGAGGSTCWERCLLSLPSLIVVLAENQREIAASLEEQQCAVDLGWYQEVSAKVIAEQVITLALDQERRRAMAKAARELVDGRGALRLVDELQRRVSGECVSFC